MSLLNPEEMERISAAVKEAEKNTGGEIVTAIIGESDDYAGRELVFAIGTASLAFIIAAFNAASLESWLEQSFWFKAPSLLPLSLGAMALAVGAVFYILAQIPFIDRIVVGKKSMTRAVRNRAMRHFTESAAYDTVDRTGVLLFISVLERRVELLADRGINAVVAPDTWDRIVSALVRGIKDGKTAESIETAVREIGTVLAEHVPPRPDDENELSDGPVELGRGS